MESLQELSCRCYIENCKVGTRVPYDIPGTTTSWVTAWMETSGLDGDEDVKRLVVDCLTHGTATRLRAYYPFRRRVDTLCDSMGINREPHTRSNLSDVVIMADKEFVWRKKKVTRSMLESWEYFRTIEPFESD